MVKLKLNGEPVLCPSCYEEIKTRHYVRILKEWDQTVDIADRDYFQLFQILTDTAFSDFSRTVENEITFHNAISWILTQDFKFSQILPKVLWYKDKAIDIPQEPGELSIGQNIHLRRDYIDKSKVLEENISIAAAIYLQPRVDNGQFSMKRAIEIAKDFDEMPAYLIYPIGFFLLRRAMTFGLRPAKTSPLVKISLKAKFVQMWRGLPRFIG